MPEQPLTSDAAPAANASADAEAPAAAAAAAPAAPAAATASAIATAAETNADTAEASAAPASATAEGKAAGEAPVTAPIAENKAETPGPSNAPASGTGEDKAQEFEVPRRLLGWLENRVPELERLSNASVELPVDPGAAGPAAVRALLRGSPLDIKKIRVLLEEELRSAPAAEHSDDKSPSSQPAKKVKANGAAPAPDGKIKLAGRTFVDRDDVDAHIRWLQNTSRDGVMLAPEDAFFIFHLATFHPHFLEKMSAPIVGFKYGPHEVFKGSKCFYLVRADGTEEGLSIRKCLEVACPQGTKGKKRPREEDGTPVPAPATGEGDKPTKDNQEEDVEDEAVEAPPHQRPRREITEGCVVDITGVPAGIEFYELRDMLGEYGHVRFVEPVRPHNAQVEAAAAAENEEEKAAEGAEAAKERMDVEMAATAQPEILPEENEPEAKPEEKGEAKTEAKTEAKEAEATEDTKAEATAEGKAEEKAETKEDVKAEATSEGKAEEKTEAKEDVMAEAKATAKDKAPVADAATSEAKPVAETKEPAKTVAEEPKEPPKAKPNTKSWRARFQDAEGASRAAAELKDVDGTPVAVRILTGDEERAFWERLWAAVDKGKGKGKDKGKGKGKDKGYGGYGSYGKGKDKGYGKDKGKSKGKGKKGKGK